MNSILGRPKVLGKATKNKIVLVAMAALSSFVLIAIVSKAL
jgi:hypothetical protein